MQLIALRISTELAVRRIGRTILCFSSSNSNSNRMLVCTTVAILIVMERIKSTFSGTILRQA
jgi:hypothetical protein